MRWGEIQHRPDRREYPAGGLLWVYRGGRRIRGPVGVYVRIGEWVAYLVWPRWDA